ncbi:DUF6292 family protein [Actinomadura sp. 21ATH]|uniref:DUF6292 family protein n=1 Tax=Actinomadura sp. 21ATH TaxID=1735444 RepID=UPI0035C2169E
MEITRELVDGYITAVADALEAAGHKVKVPAPDQPEELTAEILIPDAWTDEQARSGIALRWGHDDSEEPGWIVACYNPETSKQILHTDLRLGIVPVPEVIVRAVAAIVADGGFGAGRVVPGTAEMLARYEGGTAPESVRLDLIAESEKHGSFGYCIGCGSTDVVHRALYIRSTVRTTALRMAWCSADECQEDRVQSAVLSVPVEAGPGGFYRVVAAW